MNVSGLVLILYKVHKTKLFQNIANPPLVVIVAFVLTRIEAIGFFYFFGNDSPVAQKK
jgi:hypothetical protein